MQTPSAETLKALRERYPVGCRVRMVRMGDPYQGNLKEGDLGTVRIVDDIGTIHVAWDCGSSLGVLYGVDYCTVVSPPSKPD